MTNLTQELERLEALAKAAQASGTWWTEQSLRYHLRVADGTCPEADPPLIHACSPEVILRLVAALRESQRDAERYKWLRDCAEYFSYGDDLTGSPWVVMGLGRDDAEPCSGIRLDAAVDAAIATAKETP